jgi:hypothetical protein
MSNYPALFTQKPLSCLCAQTANAPHASCFSILWSLQWQPLQIYKAQAQVLCVDVSSLV